MQRPLGASGLTVTAAALGCNNLGRPGTATETIGGVRALVDAALEAGVRFFDVADVYGADPGLSERLLGEALAGRREQAVIATKFGMAVGDLVAEDGPRGARRYLRAAVEGSLARLGVDVIDLYQYHEPDGATPLEETAAAMQELVAEGKVRAIGHSNLAGWMIADADHAARGSGGAPFSTAQHEYSLLARGIEAEVLPAAQAHGLSVIPYFPLANGLLTGKYDAGARPEGSRLVRQKRRLLEQADWRQLDAFARFASERGVSRLAIAFGWLLSRPGVDTVIAGATTPEQVVQNAEAAQAWRPAADDLAELDAIFPPVRPVGGFVPA